MSTEIEKVKCLIIGSGPAGYTAAIYAARANMSPVLYQGMQPGGQLTTTNEVENFPGYPDGVTGPEMMIQLRAQAERFETDVRSGWVSKVDFSGDIHKVWVDEKTEIHAETVIISTGASAKYLGIESEQHYLKIGGGVSACAICDGFFYKQQRVAVIGGGNTAVEEALYLSNIASHVTVVHRRDELRSEKILQDRLFKKEKEGVQLAKQTALNISATQTSYDFTCGVVDVTLTFTSPLLMDDLELFARPVTYISVKAKSNDKKSHKVEVSFGASTSIASNQNSQEMVADKDETAKLSIVKAGTKEQPVLEKSGGEIK